MSQLVDVDVLVERMTERWQKKLGNVPNENLRSNWRQIGETFNKHIALHGTPEGDKHRVLQPATGTGKTQCLSVYASMLPRDDHPGMLVVVRMITQANDLANTINELAGEPVAAASHHECKLDAGERAKVPVLIITHAALKLAWDATSKGKPDAWYSLMAWRDGDRKLVVIDEALDIVEHAQVKLEDVQKARGFIPLEISTRYPTQCEALAEVEDVLRKVALLSQKGEPEKMVWRGRQAMIMPTDYDMTELRRELRKLPYDMKVLKYRDAQHCRRIADDVDETLKGVQQIFEQWAYYSKQLTGDTLNTARLMLPEGACGAVILDATASHNLIYKLFAPKLELLPVAQARRYDNVTLHVSFDHQVGKYSRKHNGKDASAALIADLEKSLPAERKVLVVTHQSSEHFFAGHPTKFARFEVAHWLAIDGRNDWNDFDTVVIFSLPNPPSTWAPNTFMAYMGPQSSQWFQCKESRAFKDYRDIRTEMNNGAVIVSVVQAINRVQCRRVIDEDGNCKPTDVFLLLPEYRKGHPIVCGIQQDMPGIQIDRWDFQAAKRKPYNNNVNALAPVIAYMKAVGPGRFPASQVRREAAGGISSSSFERLLAKLRKPDSDASVQLAAAGIAFEMANQKRAFFVKG